ncbi:hemerythrin domain-containing protein, partial [Acinetobacter baumannii]
MPEEAVKALRQGHDELGAKLDRLRELADNLDHAEAEPAVAIILEANRLTAAIVAHERDDESRVYPRLAGYLSA